MSLQRKILHSISNGNATGNLRTSALIPNFEQFDAAKESFRNYKHRFENYIRMKKVDNEREYCATLFLNSIGAKNFNMVTTLASPKNVNELSYLEIAKILETQLSPKPNVLVSQHQFLSKYQSDNQSIAEFVALLRTDITDCNFYCECKKSVDDIFLRAQFICGIKDNSMREKLLQSQDENSKFADIVSKAITIEAAKIDSKELAQSVIQPKTPEINKISSKNFKNKSNTKSKQNTQRKVIDYRSLGLDGVCLRCGRDNHTTKDCRSNKKQLKCKSCNKSGHIDKVCIKSHMERNKNGTNGNYNNNQIENINEYGVLKVTDIFQNGSTLNTSRYFATINIQGKPVQFEVDTGSGFTFLPEDIFFNLNLKLPLLKTDIVFRSYTKDIFKPSGKIKVRGEYNGKTILDEIFIIPKKYAALVGRSWIQKLNITFNHENSISQINTNSLSELCEDINYFIKKFSELFQPRISCAKEFTVSLKLRANAKPIFHKKRDVPYALLDKVNKEIDDLEKRGIISKTNFSDWGSPLVVIPKADGNVRLCVDYKVGVNERLIDAHSPINKIEEVLNSLRSSKFFCVLDLYKAYLHIPVDEESSKIQTISTHKGTYRDHRLSFGIKTAPSEFNRIINQILRDVPKTEYYFDDIIVHGETKAECKNLNKCLQQLQKFDMHFNQDKCTFFKEDIEFLGHHIKFNTISKSKKKIDAIMRMPVPRTADEVRSFLGMVTYYAKFMPNVSSITHPLRNLTKNDIHFKWSTQCDIAFNKLKQEIASDRVLMPFHPELPVQLACDAGPNGIVGVLSHITDQGERPIAFASRSLTVSERNYSQIDKEALAIVFAVGYFYQYLFGRNFKLITDNKPLVHIFNQNSKIPPITASRLQRYAAFLSGFNSTIVYKKGVDCLSRAPVEAPISIDRHINNEINQLCNDSIMQISTLALNLITLQLETKKDPILSKIMTELQNNSVGDSSYYIENSIIFKGQRVVIPIALQKSVLNELHQTHIGISKMKQLARRYVYWQAIDKDIERLLRSCEECMKVKSSPSKAPLHSWEQPERNWQRIHMDYAGMYQGHYFFVVIDAKSKWAAIGICSSAPTSTTTIGMLNDMFARHGYPDVLVSDNATIFHSEEFKNFCSDRGIYQKFIAPGHPATNGLAERHIETFKHRLASMLTDNIPIREKVRQILFRYRATPLQDGETPSEKYLNRQIRIQLEVLKPIKAQIPDELECTARQLSVGERVMARYYDNNKPTWKLGVILKKFSHLHYLVKLDDGFQFKRHINQLKSTNIASRNESQPQVTNSNKNNSLPSHNELEPQVTNNNNNNASELQDLVMFPSQNTDEGNTPASSTANQPTVRVSNRQRNTPAYLNDFICS